MDMDERWQNLPEDLHEKILHYVPIPDLFRYQAVSRRWFSMIAQPVFATRVRAENSYLLMTADVVRPRPNERWEICDTNTHHHYMVNHDFLLPLVSDRFSVNYRRTTIAADKGFLLVLMVTVDGEEEAIFVTNPLTKSYQELPPFFNKTEPGFLNPGIAMIVADDMLSYKIYVVLECALDAPTRKRSWLFNSRIGEWNEFTQPPPTLTPCNVLRVGHLLYTIFMDLQSTSRHRRYKIYSYDTERDVWTHIPVKPPRNVCIPQLVSTSGRLFFTAFTEEKISIWEIDIERRKCFKLVEMEEDTVNGSMIPNYESDNGGVFSPYYDHVGNGANILAFGSGGFIFFSSVTSDFVAYHLATATWLDLPGWRSFMSTISFENMMAGLFGGITTLTMCPVPTKDSDAGAGSGSGEAQP